MTKYISNGHYSPTKSTYNNKKGVADHDDIEMELTKVHEIVTEDSENHRAKLKTSTSSDSKLQLTTFENAVSHLNHLIGRLNRRYLFCSEFSRRPETSKYYGTIEQENNTKISYYYFVSFTTLSFQGYQSTDDLSAKSTPNGDRKSPDHQYVTIPENKENNNGSISSSMIVENNVYETLDRANPY